MALTEHEIINATRKFLADRQITGLVVVLPGEPGWTDILLLLLAYEEEMRRLHEAPRAEELLHYRMGGTFRSACGISPLPDGIRWTSINGHQTCPACTEALK